MHIYLFVVYYSWGDFMATPAQMKANKKYQDKLDRIVFYANKGGKEKIKAHAESLGLSLNAYIVKLIEKDMESHL